MAAQYDLMVACMFLTQVTFLPSCPPRKSLTCWAPNKCRKPTTCWVPNNFWVPTKCGTPTICWVPNNCWVSNTHLTDHIFSCQIEMAAVSSIYSSKDEASSKAQPVPYWWARTTAQVKKDPWQAPPPRRYNCTACTICRMRTTCYERKHAGSWRQQQMSRSTHSNPTASSGKRTASDPLHM